MTKVAIEKRKPMKLFVPVQRVFRGETPQGNEFRVVEGYGFVNPEVGDGFNLTRSAMVAATDDYMKWGAVREMHQPSAVGTAVGTVEVEGEMLPLGVIWDDTGAMLRSKVVDPEAIRKVDEGVYKGYSVGVRPKVMRGNAIVECVWTENSLVDRPADPDAVFTFVRADDPDKEGDVIRYWDADDNWVDGPYTFAQRVPDIKEQDVTDDIYQACYALVDSIRSILAGGGDDTMQLCQQSIDEFASYLKTDVVAESGESTDRIARLQTGITNAITRFTQKPDDSGLAEKAQLLTRAQTAEATVTAVRADLATAHTKIEQLEGKLSRVQDPAQPKPLRFPVDRTFPGNVPQDDEASTLHDEWETLSRTLKDEPDEKKRVAGVVRMQQIKGILAQKGTGV